MGRVAKGFELHFCSSTSCATCVRADSLPGGATSVLCCEPGKHKLRNVHVTGRRGITSLGLLFFQECNDCGHREVQGHYAVKRHLYSAIVQRWISFDCAAEDLQWLLPKPR